MDPRRLPIGAVRSVRALRASSPSKRRPAQRARYGGPSSATHAARGPSALERGEQARPAPLTAIRRARASHLQVRRQTSRVRSSPLSDATCTSPCGRSVVNEAKARAGNPWPSAGLSPFYVLPGAGRRLVQTASRSNFSRRERIRARANAHPRLPSPERPRDARSSALGDWGETRALGLRAATSLDGREPVAVRAGARPRARLRRTPACHGLPQMAQAYRPVTVMVVVLTTINVQLWTPFVSVGPLYPTVAMLLNPPPPRTLAPADMML